MSRILAPLALAAAVAVADPSIGPTFPTPEAATDALAGSLARRDVEALRALLGPERERLVPLDDVSEPDREEFLAGWARGHRVERDGATARLVLGDGWTLPVPLVQRGEGWAFDTLAGVEEVRVRRIGRNDSRRSRRCSPSSTRSASMPGRTATATASSSTPAASRAAPSSGTGCPGPRPKVSRRARPGRSSTPRRGATVTTVTGSGSSRRRARPRPVARGATGAGMTSSADSPWSRGRRATGRRGVKSFLVSHEGEAFEKDLGSESAAVAVAMERFDPVPAWTRLPPP